MTNYINHKHPIYTTIQHVREIATPLKDLGICYFTYTRTDKNGDRIYLTTHAPIMENYLNKKLYLKGNTEANPAQYRSQIVFWDTLPNQTIYEYAKSHDVAHGMYIIEPHDTYCEFFGFATNKNNHHIINTYLTYLDRFKNFTSYFVEKAYPLIQHVEKRKIVLPFRHEDNSTFYNSSFINTLSKRQLQCARLLVDGKTMKEMANSLHLSPRTIEHYLYYLKEKLGCKNKTELTVKLVTEIFMNLDKNH